MDPAAWGYFESFLVPVLDNVVSKGNLARCWLDLWSSHTRLRPEPPETHFLLSVHSVWATQRCYQPSAT